MTHTTALLVLLAGLAPSFAGAGPLAPRRPSEVGLLSTSGDHGPCSSKEFLVDHMAMGGGPFELLAIPEHRVFVVTSVDFWASGTPGRRYQYVLMIDGQGILVGADAGTADSVGAVSGSFAIPTGAVVRPELALCSSLDHPAGGTSAFAVLHGFFAKDR
jgi:hypothetical protein